MALKMKTNISSSNSSSNLDRNAFIYSTEASIIQTVSLVVIVLCGLADKRPKLCLVGIWIICAMVSFIALGPFSGWDYMTFNSTTAHCGISFPVSITQKFRLAVLATTAFIIPLSLMTYAYWRIYSKVNHHERRLSNTGTINIRKIIPVKKKLTITLCLMFGTFVTCWSPFFLLISMAICLKSPSDLPNALGRFAYWFGYINCCINPVVYCMRTSTFKEMMRGRSTSLQTLERQPRKRRAQSLPILSTKNRRMSSISIAIRPAPETPSRLFFDTSSSNSSQSGTPNVRVHRKRAFSWTANYTVAEAIEKDIQESRRIAQRELRLPLRNTTKRMIFSNKSVRTSLPPTIVESPLEATNDVENIHMPCSVTFLPCMEIVPRDKKMSSYQNETIYKK
ncbi:histamine H2 receptor-like [Actinia tenebrosa]|uniref:Histamine H2 receptor-like n=1 Tax=Actinia tenebrosa TaxID=6105 RepID=A0A6P8J059_ACTTE|nr:histamine H2 receptor-like [Actinia tenebrosa]